MASRRESARSDPTHKRSAAFAISYPLEGRREAESDAHRSAHAASRRTAPIRSRNPNARVWPRPGCFGPNTKTNRCLAEGRKSFLERYARIESGGECERLAPLLSAFVDGEADPARVLELRRHLRGCPACRASVRGLHEASQPLSVVFPAVGLAAASGGAEQTSRAEPLCGVVTTSALGCQRRLNAAIDNKRMEQAKEAGAALEGARRTVEERAADLLASDTENESGR